MWDRPTAPLDAGVAVLLGGPAFWFGMGPGLAKFKYHWNRAVSALAWLTSLGLILVTMMVVVPIVRAYVAAAF